MTILRLSQGYLNLLTACPRKFQYSYLDHLETPTTPEQQARMAWGTQFHWLMQQRELGLTITPMLADNPHLQPSLQALLEAAPQLFQAPTQASQRSAEHNRAIMVMQDDLAYLLTVIYDLLILDPHQAHIIDWKTYAQPQQSAELAHNWQTRLYPYVLAETSDYSPEQISMTYWFVQASDASPTRLCFPYSQAQHDQTHADLTTLLTQLTGWLQQFWQGSGLPQVPESSGQCRSCPYAVRCQRHQPPRSTEWLQTLTEVDEVSLL